MNKSKAFVDTTILTNYLIKSGEEKREAKESLAKYKTTELPVYAIKEFKAGPLDYVKYLHNKLLETGSIEDTIIALSKLGMQRNRQATALQLLGEYMKRVKNSKTNTKLKIKYNELADEDIISYDALRLETKVLVYKAWKKRRSVTTKVVEPLSCYKEVKPFEEKNGNLSLKPKDCNDEDCCLTVRLREEKRFQVTQLRVSINKLPNNLKNKPENVKRLKILKEVGSNARRKISNSDCRNLGDAVFALFCPNDADILTTNIKDHKPLAEALNKTAVSPKEILAR